MEVGNALEQVVLRAMERASWDVIPANRKDPREVSVQIAPNLVVTGHPDATGVLPFFGGPEVIVEVKTRGPEPYKRWQVLGAERSHPESVVQAALYSYGSFGEAREVIIATMDTGSREWDTETIPAERVEHALEKARALLVPLAEHFSLHGEDLEVLPQRDFPAGHWRCKGCPFLNTCQPGMEELETEEAQVSEIEGEEVTKEAAQEAVSGLSKGAGTR